MPGEPQVREDMGRDHSDRRAEPMLGQPIRVRVPSKVNLFLAVRGLRDDGYHELVSIMQTVGIHDVLTVQFSGTPLACMHPAARRFMQVSLEHDAGDAVPSGEQNLVCRTAREMLEVLGLRKSDGSMFNGEVPTTRMGLTKSIPIGAGMAGGSADAAAALVALNRLWEAELDRDQLREVAARIGADVPFCLTGGTALATGTGTATAQVLCRGRFHWVVGMSDMPLSTPEVYATWDEVAQPSVIEPDAVLAALNGGDAEALGAALHNDLEAAAFHLRPELREARDAMLDAGALGAVVSGSGPTLVALASSETEATRIAAEVAGYFDRVETARSPSGGPEVVSG